MNETYIDNYIKLKIKQRSKENFKKTCKNSIDFQIEIKLNNASAVLRGKQKFQKNLHWFGNLTEKKKYFEKLGTTTQQFDAREKGNISKTKVT